MLNFVKSDGIDSQKAAAIVGRNARFLSNLNVNINKIDSIRLIHCGLICFILIEKIRSEG